MNSNRNKEGGRDGRDGRRSNSNSYNHQKNSEEILAKNVDLVGKISGIVGDNVYVQVDGMRDYYCQEPHPAVLRIELSDRSLRVSI